MDLRTAQYVIRDSAASFEAHVEAAAVICEDSRANPDDLFACLTYPGLPTEYARTAIRTRLERDGANQSALRELESARS